MRLALIADPDLRERMRCVRVIAGQTTVSGVGVGTWSELELALDGVELVPLILFTPSLPGAPDDAVERLRERTQRLVVTCPDQVALEAAPHDGLMRAVRPLSDERLVLLARGAGRLSSQNAVSFAVADILQMVCSAGASHALVVSHEGRDTGVIEVSDGQAWTAFDALGVGEAAFVRLLRPEMRARVSPARPSTKERTLFRGLSELLLDSLRRHDEGAVVAPPPLSAEQLEFALAASAEQAARIKDLTAVARRQLMQRDYDEAARTLARLAELDPASAFVRANLEQLRKLGYPR